MLSTAPATVSRRNVSWSKRTLDQYQAQHFYLYCLRSSWVGVTQLTQSLVLMCSATLFSLDHINRDERAPQSIQWEESCWGGGGGGGAADLPRASCGFQHQICIKLEPICNCECENHMIMCVIRINAGVFSGKLNLGKKHFDGPREPKSTFLKVKIQQLGAILYSSGC